MEYVNEPAARVEEELRGRGVTVRREPYNPRERSLLSDLVGFLRTPDAGSTVTLFEDPDGTVRYYTVTRTDPEVDQIRTEVAELRETAQALEPARLAQIERRLAAVDELQARVEKVPELEERVDRLAGLETRVEERVERLAGLETKVEELSALETKVTQLDTLRTRVERLERPR